ncbi:MAG: lipoprotein NlpI [bacterium ADurb.Bin243]|nr:MAG: lipoprotein NlpI [bacterium ADurb.Bin243]
MNKNLQLMINEIKKGLASEDIETRKKSVLMLSRIDAPEIIQVLEPLKDDSSEEIRKISSKIISVLSKKYTQSAPLVSSEHKSEIKSELERSNFDVQILSRYLSSEVRETRIAAVSAFYGVKNPRALAMFKQRLSGEKDVAVTATLVKAIGTIGTAEDIDFLTAFINHADNRVKANAIEALCLLGANYEVFREVLQLINCPDERVRITAFQYFSRIDRDVLISEVDGIFSSDDAGLKALAVKLTFFYDADSFVGLYEKHFHAFDSELKSSIIKNLKEVISPRAMEFVKKYDAVDFNFDFIDSSFMEDKTGMDIFEIEKGIKKDEEFFFDEGMLLFDLGNFERALIEFNRATRVNPKFAKAWKQKAAVYTQMENFKKALECIDRAISINPGDDDSIYSKALILQQSGDDAAAEKCFAATRKLKFNSNVFSKDKEKKISQREIKDTIDRLIGEAGDFTASNDGANDAIDRLIDEINESAAEKIGTETPEAFKAEIEASIEAASTRLTGREETPRKPDAENRQPVIIQPAASGDETGPAGDADIKPPAAKLVEPDKIDSKLAGADKIDSKTGAAGKTDAPNPKTGVKEKKEYKAPKEAARRKPVAEKKEAEKPKELEKKPEPAAEKKEAAKPVEKIKKQKSRTEPVEDNFLRNAAIAAILFAVAAFAMVGYYYNSTNEVLTVTSLAKHFILNGVNGETAYLERFAYMDDSILERIDFKGVGFSIRILKVKTPAKAENIRKNRDEGREWHVNGNFLIAVDRGDKEKILSVFKTFK